MRQWISRQDVDDTAKDQINQRGWLNPDETYDPYKSDEVDYSSDGGPVLMKNGGRAGYKGGGGPFDKTVPYISGDTVPFIDKLKLASPPAPHIPHPRKPGAPSLEGGGGDSIGEIGKSLGSLTENVSKFLNKKQAPTQLPGAVSAETQPKENDWEAPTAQTSEGPDVNSIYQHGGRVNKAGGGGFADWLAGLKGGNDSSAGVSGYAPYMQKSPSYNAPFTQNMETQPSATISNLGNMYKNAFNREADPAGLAFWQEQQKAGMSLGDIANYFAQSPEAVNRYGAEGTQNLSQLLSGAISPNATTQPYKTLYTTGGAPIVNPDGSIASFPEIGRAHV